MANLSTKYIGLELKNPIIISSSGLTSTVKNAVELEKNGAAAIVLKSIFEEEIALEYDKILNDADKTGMSDDMLDYFDTRIKEVNLNNYLKLLTDCKNQLSIPVIASINCSSSHEWIYYAKKLQDSGADALELNMFISPADISATSSKNEQIYFTVIEKILQQVTIPVALKISPYFTNLGSIIQKFSETGISGIVMFNRFFTPDFDIDKFEISSENVFSNPKDYGNSLRWISIMYDRVKCDLAATTGIHDGKTVIKQILAGAKAVEISSVLYSQGIPYIKNILSEINLWMDEKKFSKLEDFRGKMSQKKSINPATYERMQFMKYYSSIKTAI
jgi:dihydroorotate dehydrogenase (fumarate)